MLQSPPYWTTPCISTFSSILSILSELQRPATVHTVSEFISLFLALFSNDSKRDKITGSFKYLSKLFLGV